MEFSRLTMTFFRDMRMAPRDRLTETIMGSISGVSPTATASAKKNASPQLPLVNPLMRNTNGTITIMNRIIIQVKRLIPLSKLVSTCWPARLPAMVPKYVCRPVATATAVAVPLSTLVPRRQMFENSSGGTFSRVSRASYFSIGSDSPVRLA